MSYARDLPPPDTGELGLGEEEEDGGEFRFDFASDDFAGPGTFHVHLVDSQGFKLFLNMLCKMQKFFDDGGGYGKKLFFFASFTGAHFLFLCVFRKPLEDYHQLAQGSLLAVQEADSDKEFQRAELLEVVRGGDGKLSVRYGKKKKKIGLK